MRFSSSSRARALRRSEMNVVRPRMVDMLTVPSLPLEKSPEPPPPPAIDLRIVVARFSLENSGKR